MSNGKIYSGSLKTIVLKLLSEKEQMYGYEITQRVRELTKGHLKITEGALYPTLHKLEAKGFLETETKKVDNRLRKYYKLTENGQTETVKQIEELKTFIEHLQNLLNPPANWEGSH